MVVGVIAQRVTDQYAIYQGDCIELLQGIPEGTVDLTVSSPPFQSLYVYSPHERDAGNCRTVEEFGQHLAYLTAELYRVTRPGRICAFHCAQVPAMLERDGYIGMKDFRGDLIRIFERTDWRYYGEVCIDKDPQAQAIRTKSKSLLFTQMHKDSSWSRPALADYILLFRKGHASEVPVKCDLTNNEWIEWARPIWYGIRESDTLQYRQARSEDDTRHIAPLQLGTIERCVRLWSNRGETILDPFAGIASTGYVAINHGRKFLGCELKPEYWAEGVKNLDRAVTESKTPDLFSALEAES
jgi:DNA modification methylase